MTQEQPVPMLSASRRSTAMRESPALKDGLTGLGSAVTMAGILSGSLNILALSGSFFMLLVYDRVLPSHSVPTLVGLTVLVAILYLFQALLSLTRQRILLQVGIAIDVSLSRRVFDASVRAANAGAGDGLQGSRDLDQVRAFLAGPGLTALFDLPWVALYVAVCFLFHWSIGVVTLAGAAILIGLSLLTQRLTVEPSKASVSQLTERNGHLLVSLQNQDTIRALGMGDRLLARWGEVNNRYLVSQQAATNIAGALDAFTRSFRMFLQSGVLALGAFLVIQQQATAGVIIASSILTARALAPIEQVIANIRGFTAFRQSWARLEDLLGRNPPQAPPLPLPRPSSSLAVEDARATAPGSDRLILENVSFRLAAGAGLAVIGSSGSGKSTLIKLLCGAWPLDAGSIRLDGASLDQWSPERLGPHLGYLPQSVQLLPGSIADNIGRFDPTATAEEVIAAATHAGAHDLIVNFSQGYGTRLGPGGAGVSAGQAQRIALARAMFRDPFLILLDEPNSNLDAEGEAALTEAILHARRRGAIVIMVAHRPTALTPMDQVLILNEGRMVGFGPKDAILRRQPASPPPRPGRGA